MLFIECVVDGLPIPSVVWLKDGVELNGTDDTNIRIITIPARKASRIEVSMAGGNHNGEYTCVASNIAGSTSTSIEIMLQGHI